MKTLRGFDAIDIADRHNILLYDLETKKELTAERAMVQIHQRRDPGTFVIQNWPENEEEAETIVLREFQRALRENHWSEASLLAINTAMNGELPIHLQAAELAAERLVRQGKLELAEAARDFSMYRIPRLVRFSDEFLKELREIVCGECAILDVEGTFHEACLMNLFDFLQERKLTVRDIIQVEAERHPESRLHISRTNLGIQWLSRTASATKSRLKSVVQPILNQDSENGLGKANKAEEYRANDDVDKEKPSYQPEGSDPVSHRNRVAVTDWAETGQGGRISKQELIAYLQSVEIVEDPNEVDALRNENAQLQKRVHELKQDLEKVEKQRIYYEKQCQEMQRDLDVLVQAMQIAKKRDPKQDNIVDVVDATFHE